MKGWERRRCGLDGVYCAFPESRINCPLKFAFHYIADIFSKTADYGSHSPHCVSSPYTITVLLGKLFWVD